VVGVQTNLGLLRAIAAHPAFAEAAIDTGFIPRHADVLLPETAAALTATEDAAVWSAAALAVLADLRARTAAQADASGDLWSAWNVADAWRMNGDGYQDLVFHRNNEPVSLRAHPQADDSFRLDLPSGPVLASASEGASGMTLRVDGVRHRLNVIRHGSELVVVLAGRNHELHFVDPLAPPQQERAGDDRLTAPIPARVTHVLVQPGDQVKRGMPLLVLEAMKMELTLAAPIDGTIDKVRCRVGDMVEEGSELISFADGSSG
jgi:3-methylcrotonyl-CoA carboxylase alpha subunit